MVRAVDARRVVDGIGVDPAPVEGEGDASGLGQAQIGPLGDDLGADLGTIEQVLDVSLEPVDVHATGLGPELRLIATLVAGLDEMTVKSLVEEIQSRAVSSLLLAKTVDSLEIALRAG